MRARLGAALAAIMATAAAGAAAQQIACGMPYAIAPGDTLHRIAVRAYGPTGNYRTLFAANRARLGWRDASQIEVGQTIAIPCPDGAAPARLALVAAPRAPGAAAPDPAAAIAVAALGGAEAAEVAVREPKDAHLDQLGPDLHRLSLPWERPDCAAPPDALAARLCADFLWSQPLRARFDVAVTRAGAAPDAAEPVCDGPDEPSARACLDALAAGTAALGWIEASLFDRLAAEPGYADRLAERPELTREVALRAIAPAAAPFAEADIARLDAGLAALEASGAALALRLEALAPQTP